MDVEFPIHPRAELDDQATLPSTGLAADERGGWETLGSRTPDERLKAPDLDIAADERDANTSS
jgi:hypothetical protein